MEELGMTLDRDEFVDAAKRLYDTVSLPEKDILASRKQRSRSNSTRVQNQNVTDREKQKEMFKPKLNATSLKIAQKKNETQGSFDVASRLHHKKNEYDSKIMQQRYDQHTTELMGCTFHPNLTQDNPHQISARSTQQSNPNLQ